jgi:hypothetical protein
MRLLRAGHVGVRRLNCGVMWLDPKERQGWRVHRIRNWSGFVSAALVARVAPKLNQGHGAVA